MQLTIDSAQPLDDVLRVVGAMYNVNLTVDGARRHTADAISSARGGRRAAATKPRTRRSKSSQKPATTGRRRRGGRRSASTAEIRQWAVDSGYDIASKGRVPATIVDAYRSAHS